jgi:diguanylate cyclase (GGDEF)-like protein
MLIDFWREFGVVNDVEISFILTDWQDSLFLVRDGKADLHAGLFFSSERNEYLDFSKDLWELKTSLFLDIGLSGSDISELYNIKIGVVRGSYEEFFIRGNFSTYQTERYSNNQEMMTAALEGDIRAFVADYPVAINFLLTSDKPAKFTVGQTLYTLPLKAAVKANNTDLLQFINNGLKNISPEDLNRVREKWIHTETIVPGWILPSTVIFFLFILTVFIILYIFFLRRNVALKTEQLKEANVQLEILASTDQLTNIYNRRKLFEVAEKEIHRSKRYNHPLSCIMLDIDRFKKINDTYGHAVGDLVLKHLVATVQTQLRESDMIFRYGGEEFVVLMPDTSWEEGMILANRLLESMRSHSYKLNQKDVCVTFSGGISEMKKKYDSVDQLLEAADKGLYLSKRNGRDQITFSE